MAQPSRRTLTSLLATTIVIIIITVVVVVVTLCKNMSVSSLRGWATPTDAYASSNEGRAVPSQAKPRLALTRAWCCNWSCTPDSKSNVFVCVCVECALPARNMQFCTFRTIIFTHWGDHNRADAAAVFSLYMESSKCTNIASSAREREECSYSNNGSCNHSRKGNEMSCDNRMIERWCGSNNNDTMNVLSMLIVCEMAENSCNSARYSKSIVVLVERMLSTWLKEYLVQ